MRKLIIALALAASCQPAVAKGVNDEKISVSSRRARARRSRRDGAARRAGVGRMVQSDRANPSLRRRTHSHSAKWLPWKPATFSMLIRKEARTLRG
jgi:hypothetical protein